MAEDLRGKLGDSAVKSKIESDIKALFSQVNSQVEHHERLQFIAIVSDDWSIANGFLTPTMKIKRGAIEDATTDRLEGWYNEAKKYSGLKPYLITKICCSPSQSDGHLSSRAYPVPEHNLAQ